MSNYQLRSASAVLVDVPSSSSLDNPHVTETRRGTVYKMLGGNSVIQYVDIGTGDVPFTWTIPLANASQYGRLSSAAAGSYGDSLVLASPVWGDISVAFVSGEAGFRVQKHQPETFGYEITIDFVRLA